MTLLSSVGLLIVFSIPNASWDRCLPHQCHNLFKLNLGKYSIHEAFWDSDPSSVVFSG